MKETIGVFTERLCTRHDQTLVIMVTSDHHIVTRNEMEVGIELAQLKAQIEHWTAQRTTLAS